MTGYAFIPADHNKFAVYHTIYTDTNIFSMYDWNERINCLSANDNGYFIFHGDKLIGGFTLKDNQLSYPFMVPPFCDRGAFWLLVLDYADKACNSRGIQLSDIPQNDTEILIQSFGAVLKRSNCRMLRPTARSDIKIGSDYIFTTPNQDDIPKIVQTVYDAHASGYISTVRKIDRLEIEDAITRRVYSFTQTNSLHMSTLVMSAEKNEMAGVCIAGIYPDSPNHFATIHQLSVRTQYRRKGIATAMMLHSINAAHLVSPVITLGVLIGNPAELLYKKLGFASGPIYSELVLIP